MASCSKKNNNDSLLFVHFLLTIPADHHSISLHNYLEIPRKFVKSYGHRLPSRVTLKVPTGAKWPVQILRRNGQIWLQNGWPEFVRSYSLAEGSFLSFEYEKGRAFDQFNVIIFDKSMMEIDYGTETANPVDDSDTDSSVQILPSKEQFKKLIMKTTCAQEQRVNQTSFKRKKAPTKPEKAEAVYVQSEERPRANPCTFTRKKAAVSNKEKGKALYVQSEERKRINKSTLTSSNNKLTKFEKIKAIERAKSNFRSDNPFFQIVMQPSYVQRGNILMPPIPSKFAKTYYLGDRISDPAELKMLDGKKTWPIELYISPSSAYGEIKIKSSGWRKFVIDNHLQVGDVCIFELLLEYVDVTTFKVVVSRYPALPAANGKTSKDKASCSKAPTKPSSDYPKRRRVESSCDVIEKNHSKKKMKVLNRDCSSSSRARSNSGNPTTFDVLMKAAHFRNNYIYYLNLPRKIVKNMEQGNYEATLQIGNKLWRVMLNIYPKLGMFGKGWFEFAKENKLKVGDVCTFELIERQILRMRVSIARN